MPLTLSSSNTCGEWGRSSSYLLEVSYGKNSGSDEFFTWLPEKNASFQNIEKKDGEFAELDVILTHKVRLAVRLRAKSNIGEKWLCNPRISYGHLKED